MWKQWRFWSLVHISPSDELISSVPPMLHVRTAICLWASSYLLLIKEYYRCSLWYWVHIPYPDGIEWVSHRTHPIRPQILFLLPDVLYRKLHYSIQDKDRHKSSDDGRGGQLLYGKSDFSTFHPLLDECTSPTELTTGMTPSERADNRASCLSPSSLQICTLTF